MLKENVTTTTLSHNEIVFIKKLVEDEFKSNNPCESFNLKEKVFALCNKLNVTSFEEVVRKVLFYNLFPLDITDEYLAHIESYTRDNIAVRNCIRNVMIDLAMNTSDIFCDFAYHTHYFDDEDKQEEVKEQIVQEEPLEVTENPSLTAKESSDELKEEKSVKKAKSKGRGSRKKVQESDVQSDAQVAQTVLNVDAQIVPVVPKKASKTAKQEAKEEPATEPKAEENDSLGDKKTETKRSKRPNRNTQKRTRKTTKKNVEE